MSIIGIDLNDPSLQNRFWSKVHQAGDDPLTSCWEWQGATNGNGYGNFWMHGYRSMRYSHRVGYEMLRTEIPEGLSLDHLCRNTLCVNPWHLEPVDHATNMRRGVSGARRKEIAALIFECPSGHPYSDDNTRVVTRKNGREYRECKTCNRQRCRRYKARRKGEEGCAA